MSKSSNTAHYDDEIDIFQIFLTLLSGKWIIVTTCLVSLLLGVLYNFLQPNEYHVSIDVSEGSDSQFFRYIKLNDVLAKKPLPFKDVDLERGGETFYNITPKSVLSKFELQYSQKKGIMNILSEKPYQEIFNDELPLNDNILIKAKDFTISKSEDQNYHTLSFTWSNKSQINDLLNSVILETLALVKDDILTDLRLIKDFVENKKERMSDEIEEKLKVLLFQENDILNSRILYLKEQFSIAKKLGIQKNSLDGGGINSTNMPIIQNYNSQLETDTITLASNTPYYLIGYEAIDQEIRNLENRSDEDKLLLSDSYLNLVKIRREIESNLTPYQIKKAIDLFSKEDTKNWVQFNLAFAEIKNLKNSNLVLLISFFLGLFFGSIYVLINKSLRRDYQG